MDVIVYGVFIDGFCKRRDMESAFRFFFEFFEVGLFSNKFIYNSMIRGYSNFYNMEVVFFL